MSTFREHVRVSEESLFLIMIESVGHTYTNPSYDLQSLPPSIFVNVSLSRSQDFLTHLKDMKEIMRVAHVRALEGTRLGL